MCLCACFLKDSSEIQFPVLVERAYTAGIVEAPNLPQQIVFFPIACWIHNNEENVCNWSWKLCFLTISDVRVIVTASPMGSNFDEKVDRIIPSSWNLQSSYHCQCGRNPALSLNIWVRQDRSEIKACIINDITYAVFIWIASCRLFLRTLK